MGILRNKEILLRGDTESMEIKEISSFINGELEIPLEDKQIELLDCLIKQFTLAEDLHYSWGNFKSGHRIKIKIKPNSDFYQIIEKIFCKDEVLILAIDKMCIDENNRLFYLKANNLFKLLKEYYWELDEIYISNCDMDWLISINHVFEIYIVGEKIIKIIKDYMCEIESLIIEYNEYF